MEFYIAKVANTLLEPLYILSFFLYIAINLGMVTGLLPVVGVPLPILSYGGTAMLTNMIGFGIVLSSKLYNEDFI